MIFNDKIINILGLIMNTITLGFDLLGFTHMEFVFSTKKELYRTLCSMPLINLI